MKTLSNQEMTIQVAEHGAELSSVVDNATGREYLWQADPAFWKLSASPLAVCEGYVKFALNVEP